MSGIGGHGYHPIRKLRFIVRGLRYAILTDLAVSYKAVVSLITLVISLCLSEWVDVVLILIVTAIVMMAELFNTAIEELCDYLAPERHEKVGAIKDVAAAATGMSILIWLVVIISEFYGFAKWLFA